MSNQRGRKPIKTNDPTVSITIRITVGQKDLLKMLGGAAWLRYQIDAAEENLRRVTQAHNDQG